MLHLCTSIQVHPASWGLFSVLNFSQGFQFPSPPCWDFGRKVGGLYAVWSEPVSAACSVLFASFHSASAELASFIFFQSGGRCEMDWGVRWTQWGKWKNRTILKQMGMKSRKVRENQASQASQATLDSHVTFLDAWDGGTPGWGPSSSAP